MPGRLVGSVRSCRLGQTGKAFVARPDHRGTTIRIGDRHHHLRLHLAAVQRRQRLRRGNKPVASPSRLGFGLQAVVDSIKYLLSLQAGRIGCRLRRAKLVGSTTDRPTRPDDQRRRGGAGCRRTAAPAE